MNKKILGITVTILTLAMLTVPVLAGKGQNKMDFQLHLVGLATPPPGSVKTAGRNTIIRDLGFAMMGDMSWVQIGTETITADWLDYEGSLKIQQHLDEEGVVKFAQVLVNEIIYIYDDPAQEEEDLRGTIVIKALGNNKAGNGGTCLACLAG